MKIQIGMIHYPVETLGPGKRIGIWVLGCSKHCEGCMSPSFHEKDPTREYELADVLTELREICEENPVDGVTVSGGEPFEQDALCALLDGIRTLGIKDILVYTGRLFEEVRNHPAMPFIDVLVDGEYVEALNDNGCLRGSSNQRILILTHALAEKYEVYLKMTPRSFELIANETELLVIGMFPKGGDRIYRDLLGK